MIRAPFRIADQAPPYRTTALPFSETSLWNRQIPPGATYQPLGWAVPAQGYSVDDAWGLEDLDASAPLVELVDRGYWWPYPQSGHTAVPSGVMVHARTDWTAPGPPSWNYPNRAAAFLRPDGRVVEAQYVVRETGAGPILYSESLRSTYSPATGTGDPAIDGFGGHGGSGLPVLPGTLRSWELTGADPIRHVLALTVNTGLYGDNTGSGFRWPAIAADQNYSTRYGSFSNGSQAVPGLVMGALLAIPKTVDLSAIAFETGYVRKIAVALQTYGALVVDTSGAADWDDALINVTAETLQALPMLNSSDSPRPSNAFVRDMDKIWTLLAIVTSNAA